VSVSSIQGSAKFARRIIPTPVHEMVKIAQLKILTIAIVGPGVSSDSWLNHRMVLVSASGEQKQRVAAAKRDLSKSTPD
jgi:hypothetical protein